MGCCGTEKNLFWISPPEGQRNDFIFMVENTNVSIIGQDSFEYYLTQSEALSHKKINFKNFGKLYENEQYKLHVLLRIENDSIDRNYTFLLRTYDLDFNLIDTYELAAWIKKEGKYCFGSINEKLEIKKSCEGSSFYEKHQIGVDGRIK